MTGWFVLALFPAAGHGVVSDAVGTGRGDSVQAGARTPGYYPRDLVGTIAGNYKPKRTGAQTSKHETLIQNIQ